MEKEKKGREEGREKKGKEGRKERKGQREEGRIKFL